MSGSGSPEPVGWTARRVRASGTSILLAIATIVAVLVARGVFVAASQPLGWVAAAAAVVIVVSPLIDMLDRHLPRAVAILVTLVVGVGLIVSVGVGSVLEVQDQLGQLEEELPAAAARLEEGRGPDSVLSQIGVAALVQDLVDQASERISPEPTIDDAVGTVPAFLVSGVLVVFLLIWGRAIVDGALRQISDPDRRDRVAGVVQEAVRLTERYIVAVLAMAVVVGLAAGAVAWWADLPVPFVLGVVVGAASVIPYFGVVFGGVPMLLLAAASEPVGTTVSVALALVVVQAVSTVATRRIFEARSIRAGPAVVVIAALVGSDVYGIGGALVAVVFGILAVAVVEVLAAADEGVLDLERT